LKKNIILIVNPVAVGLTSVKQLHFCTNKEGLNLALYTTTAIDDISKIKSFMTRSNRKGHCSGDGTIKLVAESLENVDVVLE
jgi:hypothetical protein